MVVTAAQLCSGECMSAAVMTISLDAVVANWLMLQRQCAAAGSRTDVGAVLKADAYGLGAARVGPALAQAGCRRFFVAHGAEGAALYEALDKAESSAGSGAVTSGELAGIEIFVFHGCRAGEEALFAKYRLIPVLNSLEDVARWVEGTGGAGAGAAAGERAAALHLDTGMNRLGLDQAGFEELLARPDLVEGLDLKLIMTHLAMADEPDAAMNNEQKQLFDAMLARLPSAHKGVPVSMANTAGVLNGADFHYDVARVGIGLYGGNPFAVLENPMQPVVRLCSEILQVRDVGVGERVSYGGSWQADKPARIATLTIGYADGVLRGSSGVAEVAIAGRRAPVVGIVTMDMIMVDVTEFEPGEVQPGMMAELIGPAVPVDEVARRAGTIAYEVLTSFGRQTDTGRLQRVYAED